MPEGTTDIAGVCVCFSLLLTMILTMIFLLCAVVSTLVYFEWNQKTLYIKLDELKVSRHWL